MSADEIKKPTDAPRTDALYDQFAELLENILPAAEINPVIACRQIGKFILRSREHASDLERECVALQQEVETLREQLERAKNWKRLVMECENLLGKQYRDNKGHFYTFFGLVHSNDDYYYGMWRPGEMNLLSCVGSMETHGFELVAALEDGETKP